MAADMNVWEKCSVNFVVNAKSIKCNYCENKFHLICVGVKDNWLRNIVENIKIHWFCNVCSEECKSNVIGNKDGAEPNFENENLRKENQCLQRK